MSGLLYLIPVALALGLVGLVGFLWSLRSGQFEDLDKAARSILFEDADQAPGPAGPDASAPPPATPDDKAR